MTRRTRAKLNSMIMTAALAVPLPAMARSYIGPDGGFWNTPANWSPSGVPVNGELVEVRTASDATVNLNTSYAAPGINALFVDSQSPFVTSTINQQVGVTLTVSSEVQIGINNRGRYIQTVGNHNPSSLVVGTNAGSYGQYDLSFGSVSAGQFFVGYGGTGVFNQNSGSVTVNGGSFIVGGTFTGLGTGNGTYTLTSGTINAPSLLIGSDGIGYFQQQGGTATITSLLTNDSRGTLNLAGGTTTGPLTNNGNFAVNGGRFTGSVTNNGAMSLSSGTLSINGGGFSNFGQVGLYGGSLVLTGNATNQGSMFFNGNLTISGVGSLFNLGTITQNSGFINLNNGASSNSGNLQLALGSSLNLNNGNFTNNGTLSLNGGRIAGIASLINRFGATIRGSGVIASGFDNQGGRILLESGTTFINNAFNNSGIIQLTDDGATLAGGAITNSGLISGHGSIANQISSLGGGMVEASGGTLILGGVVNNGAGGTLSAPAGGKIFLPGGISTSGGLINLSGGYFDNNTFALSNTGQISGFGTIRTGGLTNNGSVTLTGGFSDILGNVTNAATKQIKVAYNPALFTGNVTNNGIFKSTDTTVTFSGTYTENGTFISDPADNYFSDVSIGPGGAWVGGQGDRFILTGDLAGRSLVPDAWQTNQAQLHFTGGVNHILTVLGQDLGINFAGYDNNFAWGILTLDPADHLTLQGQGALYVHELHITSIHQLTSSQNIYYDLRDPANSYLNGQTYTLWGGGTLTPVPEPAVFFTGIFIAVLSARHRRKS